MCEVPWNRNCAAKTFSSIVPQGLDTPNCIPVLDHAVHLPKRRDSQQGKICGKAEKNPTFQEMLLSVEVMFTAFNAPLTSSVYKKWQVLCFGQACCTY